MPDVLDEQIQVFDKLLPTLRTQHPDAWVVIAKGKFQAAFGDFAGAAIYAEENFPNDQVLIRNTEAREEFAPFILVDAAH